VQSPPRPPEGQSSNVRPNPPAKETIPAKDNAEAEQIGVPEEEAKGPAPAKIVVRLPAEARLLVNQKPTQGNSGSRTLVSPPLEPGKDFHYTLKAELVHDGRTFTATKRVAVHAGEEKHVTLELAAPAQTGSTAAPVQSPAQDPRSTAARPAQPSGD